MGLEAVHVGVDIGKQRDPTALVAVQVFTDPLQETEYRTQLIERLPLGTSYPDVAAHIVKLMAAICAMEHERLTNERKRLEEQVRATGQQVTMERRGIPWAAYRLYVDATGVGRPVVDMVQRAIEQDKRTSLVELKPITFGHGDKYDSRTGVMGKAYLVSRLQVLLQNRQLKLPKWHKEAQAMARELKDYEIHISQQATDTYGAFKVGTHDDLVTALGLAVLEDPGTSGARFRSFD